MGCCCSCSDPAKRGNSVVIKTSIIAALAGLLFGLDIAYVNGSLQFIVKDFNVLPAHEGYVAGFLLFGCAVGAIFSGFLSRKFGRKKCLVLSAAMFTVFTVICVLSPNYHFFLGVRFVLGLAIGIASFVAPLYLAEIAPYKMRGGLIAMYQLMITIGIFLMFLSNAALEFTESWKLMMLVLVIPSAIMLIGAFTLPESPRWFVLVGKDEESKKVLTKVRNTKEEVDFEYNEIKTSIDGSTGGVMELLKKPFFLKVVFLGFMLQTLQQFTGMNAFMYYSGDIFKEAGFSSPAVATVIVGLVNMLTTLIAIKYVDRLGRKPLMYGGLAILIVSCAIAGYIFHLKELGHVLTAGNKITLLIFCILFIFGFAVSLGPVVWILCSEIQPLEGRDLGITVSTTANWVMNTVIGTFTPIWFVSLGIDGTFWLFGFCCILGLFLIKFFTPETKGVPLEEIEMNLKNGLKLKDIGRRVTHKA
ncbi:MAG: sugar porter family MFS transporter [Lentisphaerota bacterium]